ncbi:MAG TPA: hypothetical protein VE309_09435 [Caulobacteraceae bacterium]|jgi:hypothetical protein|nr:hypothetical protein [Caulobacteraceae bacterium]
MLKIHHTSGLGSLRLIRMVEEMQLDYELIPEVIGRVGDYWARMKARPAYLTAIAK